MYRLPTALLVFCCVTSAQAASSCSPQREEDLVTAVIYREAEPASHCHAGVMSSLITRLESGQHGSSFCSVITEKSQYVYKLPKKPEAEKLRKARESARTFLAEYHRQGKVTTEAEIFRKLEGLKFFHMSRAEMPARGKMVPRKGGAVQVCDNLFTKKPGR